MGLSKFAPRSVINSRRDHFVVVIENTLNRICNSCLYKLSSDPLVLTDNWEQLDFVTEAFSYSKVNIPELML